MRLVVVGADASGMSAAHQALRTARRLDRELSVVVLDRGRHTSYSACGIPYWVAGDVDRSDDLVARTAAEHRAAGIDLRLGVEAVELDLARRTVLARDLATGAADRIGFDHLLLATGARPRVPGWAEDAVGRPFSGVHAVRTLDDGTAWVDEIAAITRDGGPRRAVVAGGGYIGLEMAEALLRRGLHTTLVTRSELMGSLDPDLGARVRAGLTQAGVEVVTGVKIEGLDVSGGRPRCLEAGGRSFPADLVVLGLGAEPETDLAGAAGLPLGSSGGLLPDEHQQIAEGVWAAGDCCESVERLTGRRVHVPLGTHANKQGRVAGENLAGGDARFAGVLCTEVTRFAAAGVEVEIGRTGLTSAQAAAAGFDAAALVTESTTASGYMPEAAPVAVKVLADRGTRRLIGTQLVGGRAAAKRVDIAAVAIWTRQTVDDVAAMDLAYAPPFSPVWDPVQIACRRLAERL